MNNLFKDKVVVVTGASSGIGKAIAIEFAKNGSRVVLAARSEDKLSTLMNELLSNGMEALAITLLKKQLKNMEL
jgi:NADP-dependent 3-hydroxy acid dehydrogenase YdfG